MITSGIAKRYSQALFDIAREEKKYQTYYDELKQFSSILDENVNLKEFFANPVFDCDEKKAVIAEVLKKTEISNTIVNFLKLLVDKGRISHLYEIKDSYEDLMDDVLKKARITVKTAFPLTGDLSGKLKKTLEGITGKEVEMIIEEDRSLLGGIIVKIGDTLYDGSIKSQLNDIRELLREEK